MPEKALTKYLENNRQQLEKILLDLVSVESVELPPTATCPFGEKVEAALNLIVETASRLGLKAKNHNGYYVTVDLGEIKQPNQAVGVLTHCDIVPLGNGWNYNPLGEITADTIYGRGTLDDKGPTAAILMALAAFKDNDVTLTRPVRLIVGGNEESGFRCIHKYVETDIPLWGGFSPDADFPIIFAEKGIAQMDHSQNFQIAQTDVALVSLTAGTAVNAVPGQAEAVITTTNLTDTLTTLEQILKNDSSLKDVGLTVLNDHELKITSIGKSAHGSTPELGRNAIFPLITSLTNILPANPLTNWLGHLMELFADHTGAGADVACSDKVSGGLTLNLGVLRYDQGKASLELDMRYPVTCEFEPISQKLISKAATLGIDLTCSYHQKPLYVEQDSALVQTLLGLYREQVNPTAQPIAIGGGTYCRAVPNFVAFGPVAENQEALIHQADECIDREHLLFLAQIYALAIYRLAR